MLTGIPTSVLNAVPTGRVCVVLVRARNPNNIGAVARAMHDFGFRDLRVVNEYPLPFEAARSAVDASEVLAGARVFGSVAEAVADCTLVVGTTAVGERAVAHTVEPLSEAVAGVRRHLYEFGVGCGGDLQDAGLQSASPDDASREQVLREDGGRVALLFGSEKTGLSNEELSHCRRLLTIPMHRHAGVRHASMNLGQAVAVCLYELVREPAVLPGAAVPSEAMQRAEATGRRAAGARPAGAAEVERVALLLNEVLEAAGYRRHHPANSELEDVRRLVVRMGLAGTDAAVWLGMLRQLMWFIAHNAKG